MNSQEFFTPPVIWFLIGLACVLLELVIPGLIIIFFGIGAWITSLCLVIFDPGLNFQLLIFLSTSILSLLALRKFLRLRFFGATEMEPDSLEDEFLNKTLFVDSDFKIGVPGKIDFKGTNWTAISDIDLKKGDQVKIVNKESLTLHITKIN
jgi:inner membrane protein